MPPVLLAAADALGRALASSSAAWRATPTRPARPSRPATAASTSAAPSLTSRTDAVKPAGAAPVGDGGPFVGPYVVAANNDAHVAPGWAPTNTTTTFSTLYRKTTGGTVQHVRITLPRRLLEHQRGRDGILLRNVEHASRHPA